MPSMNAALSHARERRRQLADAEVSLTALNRARERRRQAIASLPYRPYGVPPWWCQAIEEHLRFLARGGRRPRTLRAYRFCLEDFGRSLERGGIGAAADISRELIEAWQDRLQQSHAPKSQQLAGTALRGLLKHLAKTDQGVSLNLWLWVADRKVPRAEPRPIPDQDLALICRFLELREPVSLIRLRNRALWWVLYSSGARISEALQLRRDAFLKDGTATVIQKGGHQHRLVISGKARAAVEDYISVRLDDHDEMFVSHGRGARSGPLDPKMAQQAWDRFCAQLGIARFTHHRIRHSCATAMLRLGVNPLVIAKHLGHRNLNTISNYAAVELDSRIRALEALEGA